MKELSIQSFSHSESPLDDAIATSEYCGKNVEVLRNVHVYFQNFNVIWSKMNGGVVDKNNPQINTLVIRASIPNAGASSTKFNFPQVLEDLLEVSMVGDLHLVELRL